MKGLRGENPAWIPPCQRSSHPPPSPPTLPASVILAVPWAVHPGEEGILPGWAQLQFKLGLGSQRWTLRKLLGKKRALPQAHSLTYGNQAMRILNFRRFDLVEANLGPSYPGALLPPPAGHVPLPARDLSVQPLGVSLTEANLLRAKREASSGRRGRLPNLSPAAPPRSRHLPVPFRPVV